jgi:TM2 domain-containing membrane protein YozV
MSLGLNLGLNDDRPVGAFVPQTPHKSAGLAFLLSLLLPGAGQFYCGKMGRGWITLGFWLLGLIGSFARSEGLKGTGILLITVLWIFSFLDAYFTAIEINRGQDAQVDVQNPRVAVTLNLLTAGFGYFYLGERSKGIVIFVATQVVRFAVPRLCKCRRRSGPSPSTLPQQPRNLLDCRCLSQLAWPVLRPQVFSDSSFSAWP